MVKRNLRDLMPAFAGLIILLTGVSLSSNTVSRLWPQKPRKVITGESLSKPEREPIIITRIKLGDRSLDLNAAFDAEDEWLRNLSFRLKNHSNKTVTYVGAEMFLSDSTTAAPAMVRQFRFGRRADHPDLAPDISLKPGDSIDVSLASQYDSLKNFLEVARPVTSYNTAMIRVYLVFFEDGSKWDLGNFYVPDSTRPSGFRKVESQTEIFPLN